MQNKVSSTKHKNHNLLEEDKIISKKVDVNILLNRVRLDQKRALKKRIVFSIILAGLVSSLAIYFII